MKTVLVPIDLSRNPDKLVEYAVALTRQLRCRLVFVYSSESLFPTGISRPAFEEAMRDEACENDRVVCRKVKKASKSVGVDFLHLDFQFEERFGSCTTDILEAANDHKAHFILLSSHGRSGLKKFFLGSTASSLIAKSPVPVFTMPIEYPYQPIKRLYYASDLRDYRHELAELKILAKLLQAEVVMVHFHFGLSPSIRRPPGIGRLSFEEFRMNIEHSLPQNIRNFMADRNGPGVVLCMFSRHRNMFEWLTEPSFTVNTAEHLECPLLSLPKRETLVPVYN